MKMTGIPFGLSDWSKIEATEHSGTTGMAYWRTCQFGDLRVRMCRGLLTAAVSSLGERVV